MDLDPNLAASLKVGAASFAGGVMRMSLRPAGSLLQTALLLFSCVTCGFYGTEPLIDWLALPRDYAGAVGALIGFLGLSGAEGLLKAVDKINIRELILKFLTRNS